MNFSSRLIDWQRRHGRHGLPWQGGRAAYPVWVSEIMLQQTQVSAVIPYYLRFMARFPDLPSLAAASEEEVLAHWAGLGYYARGRNLRRAAQQVMERHGGEFPRDFDSISALPGIGRSTAAAIGAFAFGERRAILDGNVKRVLTRVFGVDGWPGEKAVENRLWQLAESLLPQEHIDTYTQALMDLGATVCTRSKPLCGQCPVAADCVARREGRTAQLPVARPRKPLPERAATLLLLRHGQDILLQKRPAPGIWGGLWSLPELGGGDDGEAACLSLTGQAPQNRRQLEGFSHTFTHFRLHITPLELRVAGRPSQAGESGLVWMDLREALSAAIPRPVKSLLQSLC